MMEIALKKPELLAPAGSLEKLKIAVHYGADAVYIGGQKFGLRSNADNFSFSEMKEGVAFAEKYGAKVFVATNIYAHNEDLAEMSDYMRGLKEAGIHAVIAADPAIIESARQAGIEVHLSTQQSTLNWQAVQFWKDQGVDRVVLAREVSMEIKSILKLRLLFMGLCAARFPAAVCCPTILPIVTPTAEGAVSPAVGCMIFILTMRSKAKCLIRMLILL